MKSFRILFMVILGATLALMFASCGGSGSSSGHHKKADTAPVANAGEDQTGSLNWPTTLDGNASSDANSDTLTYTWTLVAKPYFSTAGLVNATSVNPILTPDQLGTYVVQLVVNDGKVDSAPDLMTVTVYANGTLDPSFGTDGIVTNTVSAWDATAYGVAIDALGNIVVGGRARFPVPTAIDYFAGRYKPDGTLDTSFNSAGAMPGIANASITDDSGEDDAWAMAITPDGGIVVAGDAYDLNTSTNYFGIVKFNSDGMLDTSFNGTGIVNTPMGWGSNTTCYAVAADAFGNIVAAGTINDDFGLVRYKPDGTLDDAFGTGGIVTTDILGNGDDAEAIVIQPDGRIVAAGEAYPGYNWDIALAQYNPDGTLDNTFGAGGKVTTTLWPSQDATAVALQSDGKIVAAGLSYNNINWSFALERFNTNGTLDDTFGTGGGVRTDLGTNSRAKGVAIQSDGKIVVVGYKENSFDYIVLARYNTDGTLDTTFGTYGIITMDMFYTAKAYGVAIQPDGKIVVVGSAGSDILVARFLP